ncbi:hypothetical protein [Thiolapillus sp.]
MKKAPYDDKHLDAVARLTQSIVDTDKATLAKLQGLIAATLRAAPDTGVETLLSRLTRMEVSEQEREAIRSIHPGDEDQHLPPLHMERIDERENLIEARISGPLSALGGAERLGPFVIDGSPVWFEFYRPARRFVVTETGASAPAFVMTSARRPVFSGAGPLTLDLQKGTIWIRGDLINNNLPAGAYVGITVDDGKLTLPNTVNTSTGQVEVSAALVATVRLKLRTNEVSLSENGCNAQTRISLPDLTLIFSSGNLLIEAEAGKAEAWSQQFEFGRAAGTTKFIAPLWTLLLDYSVEQQEFNANTITSDLVDYQGKAQIIGGGLALPVVVANPAVLGPALVSPGWWMAMEALQACWYPSGQEFHTFKGWMGISISGVTLFSAAVPALDEPVATNYRLWKPNDAPGKRIPWRHGYGDTFLFYHRCDAKHGEDLLTTGAAKVVLDRPVQTNGMPVLTPTTLGTMHQHKSGSSIRVTLAALIGDAPENQLALRNALCWTTRAVAAVTQGTLTERRLIDDGSTHLFFGVFAWAPILPDPYVGNFQLCRPAVKYPQALLFAKIDWKTPADVTVSFTGQLGPPIVCDKPASDVKPVPMPQTDLNPDVGLTQTTQHKRHLTKEESGEWHNAKAREERNRSKRLDMAKRNNQKNFEAIDAYTQKALGPTPPVFLLDVSTNQDLLGVALWASKARREMIHFGATSVPGPVGSTLTPVPPGLSNFPVRRLDVHSPVQALRLVTLPQIQWEPVRTLDEDQDILTLGWFPTPLASATDGGATVLGAQWQKLSPVIPRDLLEGTCNAFKDGTKVTFRTTLPFGLMTVVTVNPKNQPGRVADLYELSQPAFPDENTLGGIQITAKAEGGRPDNGNISPYFAGLTRQMINGVDLATGAPLGLSVLSSTGDPMGDVETIFNNDMETNPKVPVTRFDLSGYGGSNFSEWEDPLALFAATSKTQFEVIVGRTALEIIKVASVLHPWGIRVTRSVIVERKAGGGIIRRDTGWRATSPGLFDYRYYTTSGAPQPKVAPYIFDSGLFKGLFNIRSIRPAPGLQFSDNAATTMVPYYFDAELRLDGLAADSTQAIGLLGWLQTAPSGDPAPADALRQLIETQGAIGGPIDAWLDLGASKMPFRARRIEVGLADDAGNPVFVATVRGVPKFPKTGAWSVVCRDTQNLPSGSGEAVPVSETKGVPIIRRHPIEYIPGDTAAHTEPPIKSGQTPGDWRFADAGDLLTPASPKKEYCILQSTPTHAFLFPRPYARSSGSPRLHSDVNPEFADIIARSTSKGAFPPPENAIQLSSSLHFNVGTNGTLALSDPVSIINHPTPLRLSGSTGHGSEMRYEKATLQLNILADSWSAEFNGLEIWSDIAGMEHTSGARLRIVGSSTQRPQITRIDTMVHESIEKIMTYLPIFGSRDPLGPIDLGASNTKHEIKINVSLDKDVPENGWSVGNSKIKLSLGVSQSTGFDLTSGGAKASATLKAALKGEIPLTAIVYLLVQLEVKFTITSVSGSITTEKFDLLAFVGIGVKGSIGPFQAYAYLGIGFVLSYDILNDKPKYGGLVRLEAGVEVVVVKIKLTAELQGLVYKENIPLPAPAVGTEEKTMCDYSGKVKLQVDIFLIISISATYSFSGKKELE